MIYLNCCLICCLCEVSRGPQGAKGRDSAPLVNDNESSSLCRNQYLVRHILFSFDSQVWTWEEELRRQVYKSKLEVSLYLLHYLPICLSLLITVLQALGIDWTRREGLVLSVLLFIALSTDVWCSFHPPQRIAELHGELEWMRMKSFSIFSALYNSHCS